MTERDLSAIDSATLVKTPNAAEAAIAALEANGVDVIFGIPGVHTLALYDALHDSKIRHVLGRHEQGVGFMADGYARASGKPGVALVITGPGVTNVATAVGQAYTDSSPLFVLSSNVKREHLDGMRGNLHDLKDQMGVMAAVTQWNARVMEPNDAFAIVSEGFRRIESGRPSPVHVEIPIDVLDEPAGAFDRDVTPGSRPVASDETIRRAAERLANAGRVVIYCGGGAVSSGAAENIAALADRLNAVVVTSFMGKGTIPEDHPRAAGSLWEPGNSIDDLVAGCDLLLVVGSKMGAQLTFHFSLRYPKEIIRIEIDPREMDLNLTPDLPILGDAGAAISGLLEALDDLPKSNGGVSIEEIAAARRSAERGSFHYERLPYVQALRRAIPRDGILVGDMTQMSYVSCGLYPVYEPRTFFFPQGYGTLGFGMPAAIGAKIARPEKAVVCIVGDGGYQFTMSELGVAVQEKLGLPIVIFNDSTYSAVKEAQADSREGRYIGIDLVNPDYVDLAKAYRIPGVRAHSPEEMEAEIKAALERSLPTIIDVPVAQWV
jgi:thiamine pyrophosphate-dependent acetolactate synthase large subunit-like protein